MKIKILSSALEDLYEARLFYERQGEGVGGCANQHVAKGCSGLLFLQEPQKGLQQGYSRG